MPQELFGAGELDGRYIARPPTRRPLQPQVNQTLTRASLKAVGSGVGLRLRLHPVKAESVGKLRPRYELLLCHALKENAILPENSNRLHREKPSPTEQNNPSLKKIWLVLAVRTPNRVRLQCTTVHHLDLASPACLLATAASTGS
jgi:hypothetical protein